MKPSLYLALLALAVTGMAAQTSSKPKPKAKTAAQSAAVSSKEVQDLRSALAAQQQQMEAQRQQMDALKSQMQQLLDATQQANATALKAQSSLDQAQSTAAQAQQSAADASRMADQASANAVEAKTALSLVTTKTQEEDKKLSTLSDLVGRFRLTGDVRVRGEGFFQDGVPARNRARIRVRLGIEGQLNQDFVGGLALASGTLGDPTSSNESLTNFFDRKTIGLDRGYITYNPVAARWLSLTGGKFAYPWLRTSLTMDPDINPEGFDEKFSFNFNSPVKNFTVQAMQLIYSESAKGDDSFVVGGQASSVIKLGPWTTTPSFSLMDWRWTDALLQASAFAVQSNNTVGTTPPVQLGGEGPGCASIFGGSTVPPCAFAANGMTNSTFLDSKGKPHFLSGFVNADFILNNQVQTGFKRLPFNLVLEFENNLHAKDHPLDSKGNPITSLGSQNKAYLIDASFGQNKNRNDVQFGYSYWRIEQDAILASFAESDQRAPTNILQNRFYAIWKLRQNVMAQYSLWVGHTLNSNLENAILATGIKAGQVEPSLRRQQFDLMYTF